MLPSNPTSGLLRSIHGKYLFEKLFTGSVQLCLSDPIIMGSSCHECSTGGFERIVSSHTYLPHDLKSNIAEALYKQVSSILQSPAE